MGFPRTLQVLKPLWRLPLAACRPRGHQPWDVHWLIWGWITHKFYEQLTLTMMQLRVACLTSQVLDNGAGVRTAHFRHRNRTSLPLNEFCAELVWKSMQYHRLNNQFGFTFIVLGNMQS